MKLIILTIFLAFQAAISICYTQDELKIIAYEIDSIGNFNCYFDSLDSSGTITLEQLYWGKWISTDTFQLQDQKIEGRIKLHAGLNQYRFKSKSNNSDTLTFYLKSDIEDCSPKKYNNKIEYNDLKNIELYDAYGTLIKKCFCKKFDIKGIKKGAYYLIVDGKPERIIIP